MTGIRVMVVEDDAVLGLLFGELLEGMGHVVCAIEATEAGAVAAAAYYRPALMIVDVKLGVGSGVAAVTTILRNGFIPHVFCSGDISGVQAARPSAVAIQKPFRIAELARAIDRALDVSAPKA